MIAETFEHNGYTVKIIHDEDAESPDSWGDDDILIVTTHNRYFKLSPDVCGYRKAGAELFNDKDFRREVKREYHILPLYAYIHSGVALSLGRRYPFNDQWDSGQIGFVLVRKRQGFRNIRKVAESHVETWNQYLSGDVYGYTVEGPNGEDIDSCWGFYGFDYARAEAIGAVPNKPPAELSDGDDIGMYFEQAAV